MKQAIHFGDPPFMETPARWACLDWGLWPHSVQGHWGCRQSRSTVNLKEPELLDVGES